MGPTEQEARAGFSATVAQLDRPGVGTMQDFLTGLRTDALRERQVDVDDLFDDLSAVLEGSPTPGELPGLAQRLYRALHALLRLSGNPVSAGLAEAARALTAAHEPHDIGHLRRLALVLSHLADERLGDTP